MKIVIFGANGQTGKLLTQQALAAGHTVTAVTRHPETFPLRHANLQVLRGDVFDLGAVEQAVAGQEAVLSTLGVPFSRQPITVYSQGAAHIVRAMHHAGVRRLVCVSSSATEPHVDPQGGFIFERIIQPAIIRTIGRTTYEDMRRMETLVMNSHLEWTIVRPSGLFETPAVTDYQVAETYIRSRFTARADLAACLLQQLTTEQYLHKIVAVGTFAVQPNLLKLIMKEAFQPAKS
ncbi:MAG: SDR family oxidoreductase [Chloroflexi bacterium]|nr:SDR family oxidoreductase [Chloroflexota bacterium]